MSVWTVPCGFERPLRINVSLFWRHCPCEAEGMPRFNLGEGSRKNTVVALVRHPGPVFETCCLLKSAILLRHACRKGHTESNCPGRLRRARLEDVPWAAAAERFANEVRVLRFLEARGCPFVPRLVADDKVQLKIVTTNCGSRVEHLDEERRREPSPSSRPLACATMILTCATSPTGFPMAGSA